jgi:hypothetical protein
MSMNAQQLLDAVAKLSQQREVSDTDKKMVAFESLLNEISTALSELVALMEKGDDGTALAKALAAAMREVRVTATPTINVAAPQVTVTPTINVEAAAPAEIHVSPTPVHVDVKVPKAEPPVIHIERLEPAKGWDVEFKYVGGLPVGATFTRLP